MLHVGDDPVPGKHEAQHDQGGDDKASLSRWLIRGHVQTFLAAILRQGDGMRKHSISLVVRDQKDWTRSLASLSWPSLGGSPSF